MNYLRKAKPSRPGTTPISLSLKRYSLNNQHLLTPLKLDLSITSHQNTEGSYHINSQSNKSEVTIIKNDRQSFLIKQTNSKNELQQNIKQVRASTKHKNKSSFKRVDKKSWFNPNEQFDKVKILMKLKQYDYQNRSSNSNVKLQNMAGPDVKDYKYLAASRNGYVRDHHIAHIQKNQAKDKLADVEVNFISSHSDKLVKDKSIDDKKISQGIVQESYLNQAPLKGSQKLNNDKNDIKIEKQFPQKDNDQKLNLMAKINNLHDEVAKKQQFLDQQSVTIRKLSDSLQILTEQNEKYLQAQNQIIRERDFINQKYKELIFHNQNLGRINMELSQQNHIINNNNIDLHNNIEDSKKMWYDCENQYKRKLEYQLRDINQYQKRQDIFTKEIDTLNSKITELYHQQQTQTNNQVSLCNCCQNNQFSFANHSGSQNNQIQLLREQIDTLNKQLKIENQIKQTLTRKYQQELSRKHTQFISSNYLEEINSLTNQNAILKTRVNFCESKLESLTEQSKSYLQQIALYEEREISNKENNKLSVSEWEQMIEQIEKLKQENELLRDEIEKIKVGAQILSQQTGLNSITQVPDQNLLELANNQLLQIQKLRQRIRQFEIQARNKEQEITEIKLINNNLKMWSQCHTGQLCEISQTHFEWKNMFSLLESKSKQLLCLKEFVFSILMFKIRKQEKQNPIDYYLCQLDRRIAQLHKLVCAP